MKEFLISLKAEKGTVPFFRDGDRKKQKKSKKKGLSPFLVDFRERISYHSYFKKEKKMIRHPSAIRQWRRSLRRAEVNKKNKSMLRSQVKKLRDAIEKKDKPAAQELLSKTFAVIDKSVKKGAIHPNKGNRYKSRLSRQAGLIAPPSK
jgi:small subunit ribosomal protein S20